MSFKKCRGTGFHVYDAVKGHCGLFNQYRFRPLLRRYDSSRERKTETTMAEVYNSELVSLFAMSLEKN